MSDHAAYNPYEAPKSEPAFCLPQLEPSRRGLAEVIRFYLNGQIDGFQYEEGLYFFRDLNDPVVDHILWTIWSFFDVDDIADHPIDLSKPVWDLHQRILLALESKAPLELVTRTSKHWSWTQLAAAITLVAFLIVAVPYGWGLQLIAVSLPFGAISIVLSRLRKESRRSIDPFDNLVTPFSSLIDLREAYESTSFQKEPFRHRPKKYRSYLSDLCRVYIPMHYLAWPMFAPMVLVWQCFPTTNRDMRIRIARPAPAESTLPANRLNAT